VKTLRRDGAYVKQQRLKQITKEIAKHFPSPVSYSRMLDWIEINVGLSRSTAQRYLDLVIRAAGWAVNGDEITAAV